MPSLHVPVSDETFSRLKDLARPEAIHPRIKAGAILASAVADGRCATCRHWDRFWADDEDMLRDEGDRGACMRFDADSALVQVCSGRVFDEDGIEISPTLFTPATFGCTLWEAKA